MIRWLIALSVALAPMASRALAEDQAVVANAPAVSVVHAQRRELVGREVATGSLVAREQIEVTAQLDGPRITEVLVEVGDEVAAGQVLARLDDRELRSASARIDAGITRTEAAVAQARSQIRESEATLAEAQAGLQRTERLRRSGNATQAALDQAVMETRTAEARLAAARDGVSLAAAQAAEMHAERETARLRLSYTEVTAPAGGIVSIRHARVGALATTSGPALFTIIENGRIEVAADVAEGTLARLRPGQPATVEVIGRADPLPGRVRLIDPTIDTTTRLGRVRIEIDGGSELVLGTFARATIETARREAVAVPLSAVQFGAGGAVVQALDGDTVVTRAVRTGIVADDAIEIVDGLRGGEPIVAVSGTFLRDGDRIRPVTAAAP